MTADEGDPLWDQFVTLMLDAGPVHEHGSRYADKPALFAGRREIAHLEAPGIIDLRITRGGWAKVSADFTDDGAVRRERSRRDWIELRLDCPADLERLTPLLIAAVAANT
jgi:Luciferase